MRQYIIALAALATLVGCAELTPAEESVCAEAYRRGLSDGDSCIEKGTALPDSPGQLARDCYNDGYTWAKADNDECD